MRVTVVFKSPRRDVHTSFDASDIIAWNDNIDLCGARQNEAAAVDHLLWQARSESGDQELKEALAANKQDKKPKCGEQKVEQADATPSPIVGEVSRQEE